ncbi:microtubule-associated protein 9 isoform X2 [Notothenia coriiceps]|uniref:Microtubule-associated protein 9 isoform X2 n=1 Tax=Notothenia coriiceps TaxID=8208 RepID=A0A6I9NIE2_9TELE|nr:PREDICTED: microtubule-associated protein 9 isoform X2 [Notothenia coriiceps]
MTNQQFTTLAYTKSPKTSRRTTFQDELQAAVSARASKTETDQYSYSDDFNEDEDDFLNQLLKSRKERARAFKAGKIKSKINTFEVSDDEDNHGRTKRVSFLKSKRIDTPLEVTTAPELGENDPSDTSDNRHNNYNDSLSTQRSTNVSEDNINYKSSYGETADPEIRRQSSVKSLSFQTSDDTLPDMLLPLPSDNSVIETPVPEENSNLEESYQRAQLSANNLTHVSTAERQPPKPKPRQRTLGLSFHPKEKIAESGDSQEWTKGDSALSCSFSKSFSSKSEQSQLSSKSTIDSGSRDDFISDDSKEQESKYSTSFEEFNAGLGDASHQTSHVREKSFDTRTSSSLSKTTQRSQSACSRNVESKYLGSLKLLDCKVSLQESQPQTADSIRAAIYQEWLEKKKEKSRENMQQKKQEDILKEKKKREEEAKKGDAVASYEAWKKQKSQSLKAKAKEKEDAIARQQRELEGKQEKMQSAKQVFEQWKLEHDHLLKEKSRKQREAESRLQFGKQEKEKERKNDSKSAVSGWHDKKKDVIHVIVKMKRKEIQNKAEEERYMKEERDKMALEMYESWLVRKDLEQKRHKEERQIQTILRDSPPPPWSPPNKTVPFRK